MRLLSYLLFASASLTLFYSLYRLTLIRETFFKFNRVYLLATLIFSFAVPCLTAIRLAPISVTRLLVVPVIPMLHVQPTHSFNFPWYQCLFCIYITGAVLSAGLVIKKLTGLKKMLGNANYRAFSFFKWKVVDSRLADYALINAHEQAHVDGLHTIDVLLFELAAVVVWFNPVIYLLKTEIKSVHEYLADRAAIRHTNDTKHYAYLLLNGAMGVSPVLAHSFQEKSLLKKRIYMLQRSQSSRWVALKYFLFFPLLAVTVLFCSWANVSDLSYPNTSGKSTAPEFPGGMKRFTAYLSEAIKHSPAFTRQIDSKPVKVNFVVDVDGSVTSVTTTGGASKALSQEAIHILESCPKWHPGLVGGLPAKVQYQIKLAYQQKL
jgi:hypothetical protein